VILLSLMELNIESVSNNGSEVIEHIVEQLMVIVLHPFVQLRLVNREFKGKDLEHLQLPAHRERVPGQFEHIKVPQHDIVNLLVVNSPVIYVSLEKGVEHTRIVVDVSV